MADLTPTAAVINYGTAREISDMDGVATSGVYRRFNNNMGYTNGEYRVCQTCLTPFLAKEVTVCPACGLPVKRSDGIMGSAIAYLNSARVAIIEALLASGKTVEAYALAA